MYVGDFFDCDFLTAIFLTDYRALFFNLFSLSPYPPDALSQILLTLLPLPCAASLLSA
jgi:hypothetical protein